MSVPAARPRPALTIVPCPAGPGVVSCFKPLVQSVAFDLLRGPLQPPSIPTRCFAEKKQAPVSKQWRRSALLDVHINCTSSPLRCACAWLLRAIIFTSPLLPHSVRFLLYLSPSPSILPPSHQPLCAGRASLTSHFSGRHQGSVGLFSVQVSARSPTLHVTHASQWSTHSVTDVRGLLALARPRRAAAMRRRGPSTSRSPGGRSTLACLTESQMRCHSIGSLPAVPAQYVPLHLSAPLAAGGLCHLVAQH